MIRWSLASGGRDSIDIDWVWVPSPVDPLFQRFEVKGSSDAMDVEDRPLRVAMGPD